MIIIYKITTKSNRIYTDEDNITDDIARLLENNIVEFNMILYSAYNLFFLKYTDINKFKKIIGDKSPHMYIKTKFGLNTYYANSIVRIAESKIKSQKELQQQYIDNTIEKIKTKEKSIKDTEKYLKNLQEFEDRITEYRISRKTNTKAKLINVRGITFVKIKNNRIYVRNNKDWIECTLGQLEYNYILPEIKKQKNLLGKYKHRLLNLKIKLNKFKTLKRIIFGTKSFMKDYSKGKYTKLQFLQHKYKRYEISGRCDFLNGNRMIMPMYNELTQTLNFKITTIHGQIIYLNNVNFPYRQKELTEVMKSCHGQINGKGDGNAISCGIRRYINNNKIYYQIDVTFDIQVTLNDINYDKSTGIVAVDFNLGHVDMTELNKRGNLINYKTFYYELNKNSNENELSLRKVMDKIGSYAKDKHKIIAIEDLDLKELKTKMNSDKKHQKSLNRCLHKFPYARFDNILNYLKIKYGVDVIKVNPAFTSIIGELKYANYKKLNTHISASYVIGRRALGFIDYPTINQYKKLINKQPLNTYKSNWSMWSTLNKLKTT